MPTTTVPNDLNFSIVRRDSASWTLTVIFPLNAISQNLNTYSVYLTAKYAFTDPDGAAAFVLHKGNGRVLIDGTSQNVAHISITPADTTAISCPPPLNQTKLVYDVQIEGSDSKVYTVVRGTITVVADATITAT